LPYALFENDAQLSRAFETQEDVWQHAKEAGLVEEDGGVERLENDFTIRPCPPNPAATRRVKARV
jgi:hypothetical protein